jgi:HD-like signal output (HDOD) protein
MSATAATIDNKVKRVISNIRNLPTPPIVFHQIQKIINDPKVSAERIAGILAEDPAMSVKVLKLTNSAFYGLSREVDSIKQAVVIVGTEAIKNLVLSASVLDMFKGKNIDQDFQEKFWRHSLSAGFCCRILARGIRNRGFVDPDTAFSSGLLHDIGKMVISCFLPVEHSRLKQERESDRITADHEIEERVLGYSHAQIGGFLAMQWKLPRRLGGAITFHHHPQLDNSGDPLVYLVHLGNYLAKKTFYERDISYLIGSLQPNIMEYLQVSDDDLMNFSNTLRDEYLKAETFMQMAGIT